MPPPNVQQYHGAVAGGRCGDRHETQCERAELIAKGGRSSHDRKVEHPMSRSFLSLLRNPFKTQAPERARGSQ